MSKGNQPASNEQSSNKLTTKQWAIIAGVGVAAAPGGPVVAAGAALGTAGGCYLSNVMGWNDE